MNAAPAPIIVTALFVDEQAAWFDAQRRRYFPPERNQLAAHLTMFHHLPPSCEDEVRHRLARATRAVAAPDAKVVGLISLGRGVAYRIESPGLMAIRDDLAMAFAGVLTLQDAQGWRPHVTIQNKVPPAEAKATRQALEADFRPFPARIRGLATWWYRGGPWEALSRHMFA